VIAECPPVESKVSIGNRTLSVDFSRPA